MRILYEQKGISSCGICIEGRRGIRRITTCIGVIKAAVFVVIVVLHQVSAQLDRLSRAVRVL